MKSPENKLTRLSLQLLLASLFFISACSTQPKAVEPSYLIQYKLVACHETDVVNNICDGADQRLPFSFVVYDQPGNVATQKPEINNGEVYFTNHEYPGGHSIPLDQRIDDLCLRQINSIETFPEQIRFDLIFDTCD